MAIITLARQVGSGGQTIAARLADRLGYRLVGRRELREEARARGLNLPQAFVDFADESQLGASREEPSHLYLSFGELEFERELRGIASLPAAADATSFLDQMERERRTLFLLVQGLIYDVASHDRAVIVGGGGQLILAGVPGVLRVKVVAPDELRVERLAARFGLSLAESSAAVLRGDREQREYNRAVFDADWDDSLRWDLIVNTEFWDPDLACGLILGALAQPPFAEGPNARALATLALAGRVDLSLHADPLLHSAWIYAVPTSDGLELDGEATSPDQVARAIELAGGLAADVPVRSHILVGVPPATVIAAGLDPAWGAPAP